MNDLAVELTVPSEVITGQMVVGHLLVRNDGAEPTIVSGRLRLGEGDVGLEVSDPSGRQRRLHGRYELDAPPRPVELGPGQAIATGLNFHATDIGRVFDREGTYQVAVRYHPSVHVPVVASPPVVVQARRPRDDRERRLTELADPDVIGDACALGELREGSDAHAALLELAQLATDRPEGRLAALLAAAGVVHSDPGPLRELSASIDAAELGWLATAALPTQADPGDPPLATFLQRLTDDTDPTARRTRAMLLGEPFDVAP